MHLSRRTFHRLALSSAALAATPRLFAQAAAPPQRKIGYAVIGLGRISCNNFLPGIQNSDISSIAALVSGTPEKAARVAAQYGVPTSSIYTYEQFDRIRDNPAVDAVYIGLPNSMHAEYTIRAAQAGKHVLCEKPMSTSVADAQSMIAACQRAKRKLMIAYRCQLEPTTLFARQLIQSGELGTIQSIESSNGFNIRAGEWRLNRKLSGGGPLLDVGIYSLNGCRFLLGEEPAHLSAFNSTIDHDGRFAEVEESTAWTMRFPSGTLAACATTYGANMDGTLRVHGSKGHFTLEPAFSYEGITLTGEVNGEAITYENKGDLTSQFLREGDYFADCILHNKEPGPSGEEGLRDQQWIAAISKSAAAQA